MHWTVAGVLMLFGGLGLSSAYFVGGYLPLLLLASLLVVFMRLIQVRWEAREPLAALPAEKEVW